MAQIIIIHNYIAYDWEIPSFGVLGYSCFAVSYVSVSLTIQFFAVVSSIGDSQSRWSDFCTNLTQLNLSLIASWMKMEIREVKALTRCVELEIHKSSYIDLRSSLDDRWSCALRRQI